MPAAHRPIFEASPEFTYTLNPMRVFYLDTSFIRSMGVRLSSWPGCAQSYTSALTIIELLSGIGRDEYEFGKRRSAIGAILAGRVGVDWQMPEIRLRCAFAELRKKYDIYEKRTECLREILYCLADSTSVDEFVLREANMRLMFPLPYFAGYDERMSQHVIDSAKKWIPRYREPYGGQPPDAMLELAQLPKDASLLELATRLTGTAVDVGVTVFGLMQKFAAEAAITGDHQLRSLFASYDGSALTYVRALNSHTWRQVTNQDVPGRNFGVDLHHLIYLVRGSILVTCDHGMAKMAESSGAQVARATGA